MKKIFYLLFLLPYLLLAQQAFHNFGNIQMHEDAGIGFHTDLINDGVFDNNLGLVGFYNYQDFSMISGLNRAVFYDVEIDVLGNLELYTSMGVVNNLEFSNGKVRTPRNNPLISLDFINYNMYTGEADSEHVDGYSSILSSDGFTFPIGDDSRLRPMILSSSSSESYYNGAYFYENPNSPSTFPSSFDTTKKENFINNITNFEFWDLDGEVETDITLTWDFDSNIPLIASDINLLRVVGWNISDTKWKDLGRANVNGDLSKGTITSSLFVPDDFEIITIGSEVGDVSLNVNYAISPNGDGKNETLVIEGIQFQIGNTLEIYNRWGSVVYKTNNYQNDWSGIANGSKKAFITNEGLVTGVYFYELSFDDKSKSQNGWIYLRR